MSKKSLTVREARKKKQKRNAILGTVGGVLTAGALVGALVFTQGDAIKSSAEPVDSYKGNTSQEIETVENDGSDPEVKGFVSLGDFTLDKDVPKMIKTPRFAWESINFTAINKNDGGETPNTMLNYLWKMTDSTKTSATYVVNNKNDEAAPACTIVLSVNKLDKEYDNDLEATESVTGDDYTLAEKPGIIWTSYNLREFYSTTFAQVAESDSDITLVRGLSQNGVALSAKVSCDDSSDDALNKTVSDANLLIIGIAPVEVK